EGIDDGGETAATALRALPRADDAESALGRLGSRVAGAPSEQRAPLLAAILAIAGEPRRQREALDPEGARSCGEAMISLASRADVPRDDRAVAVSAARALAEKGYVDPHKIPEDLDPK
ncbi:MAG: thiamine biosynthesis protein, partial [Byssovorax sp.]